MRGSRRGVALLEVMMGLALLAIAGSALLAMLAQTTDAVRRRHEHDATLRAASARLDAVALWSRAELEARVGVRPLERWTLQVTPMTGHLFHVMLAEGSPPRVVLETTLYRPESEDADAP